MEDGGVPLGEYVYNIDGQRARKTAAGKITYYEYDLSGRLIHEYRAAEGVAVDYVYLAGEPLAMLVSDNVVDSFTVTPSAGANGSLTPSTAQTVDHDQTITFAVVPDAGYHLAGVTGCGGTLERQHVHHRPDHGGLHGHGELCRQHVQSHRDEVRHRRRHRDQLPGRDQLWRHLLGNVQLTEPW